MRTVLKMISCCGCGNESVAEYVYHELCIGSVSHERIRREMAFTLLMYNITHADTNIGFVPAFERVCISCAILSCEVFCMIERLRRAHKSRIHEYHKFALYTFACVPISMGIPMCISTRYLFKCMAYGKHLIRCANLSVAAAVAVNKK